MTLPGAVRPPEASSAALRHGRHGFDVRAGPAATALLLGAIAFAVYALLPQAAHLYDAYWIVPKLWSGDCGEPRHPLALHFVRWLASWFGEAPVDLLGCLALASALGTATAVALTAHAAWLRCRSLPTAVFVAVLFAALPATAHFATVIELHGPFLPSAAFAFWLGCAFSATRPGWRTVRGLVLGAASGLAACLHATGHLFAGFLGLWLAAELRRASESWLTVARTWLLLAVAHAAVFAGVAWATAASAGASLEAQAQFAAGYAWTFRGLGTTVVGEWLLPFLPASLVALVDCRRDALGIALLLALPVYLAFSHFLLGPNDHLVREFGAYLLPLGAPMALLAVHGRSRRVVAALVAIAAVGAGVERHVSDKPSPDTAYGQMVLDWLATHPSRFVTGGLADYDGVFVAACHAPERRDGWSHVWSAEVVAFMARLRGATRAEELALFLHPKLTGQSTVVAAEALIAWRAEGGIFAELADRTLAEVYELRPVTAAARGGRELRAFELVPRSR